MKQWFSSHRSRIMWIIFGFILGFIAKMGVGEHLMDAAELRDYIRTIGGAFTAFAAVVGAWLAWNKWGHESVEISNKRLAENIRSCLFALGDGLVEKPDDVAEVIRSLIKDFSDIPIALTEYKKILSDFHVGQMSISVKAKRLAVLLSDNLTL